MNEYNLNKRVENLKQELERVLPKLQIDSKKQKVLELEDKMQGPDFWSDNESAQKVSQQYNSLKTFIDFWGKLDKDVKELSQIISEAKEEESDETNKYLNDQLTLLENNYQKNRLVLLLSGKYDDHNAICSIHAGAGGVDAQDWAEMLLRQYLRFCENKGLITDIIEINKGQDAGIKSVTFEVKGQYAYGFLRAEAGVHRLVRLSPFNPAHTRETSFALLEVLPILDEQESISIDPKDIKIEVTTASGHGGQSVNTTYSAVRITHIPTGIKVSIQNERSQHQNKELAMKILTARLQTLEDLKMAEEKKELRGEFKSAEWGNQIRSYVIHPYKLVKDHRTGYEESDPDRVMNGELDNFIEHYLETKLNKDST